MTEDELKSEWRYRYEERLGILCGSDKPTPEQIKMASDEADHHVAALRREREQPPRS
jgi:hypothetical protein